jgi:hypothetical protein
MRKSARDLLLEELERLFDSNSPQKRGYSFEALLSQFLRENGFRVQRNPRIARPRQTDLVAEYGNLLFLIEAKWTKQDIGSNDLDDLRKRLERAPSDAIGCIFSFSSFSEPAVAEVIRDRSREILLFSQREIYRLFSSRISLSALIQKKRDVVLPSKTGHLS